MNVSLLSFRKPAGCKRTQLCSGGDLFKYNSKKTDSLRRCYNRPLIVSVQLVPVQGLFHFLATLFILLYIDPVWMCASASHSIGIKFVDCIMLWCAQFLM